MRIIFDEKNKVFLLHTENTTYGLAVVDDRYVEHLYYGARIEDTDIRYLLREDEAPFTPSVNKRETGAFLDCAPMEYPETGMGDYRESAFCVRSMTGYRASELAYEGYEIEDGKPELRGLPATWGSPEDCMTLKVFLRDSLLGIKVTLLYLQSVTYYFLVLALLLHHPPFVSFFLAEHDTTKAAMPANATYLIVLIIFPSLDKC